MPVSIPFGIQRSFRRPAYADKILTGLNSEKIVVPEFGDSPPPSAYAAAGGDRSQPSHKVPGPRSLTSSRHTASFEAKRVQLLHAMGERRETRLHRAPEWCMDPMTSGAKLFPPRRLSDEWFTENELVMLRSMEACLAQTGQGTALSRDLLALKIYGVGVHVVVDSSESMAASMFGSKDSTCGGWTSSRVSKAFADRAFAPDGPQAFGDGCPLSPSSSRWEFARELAEQWEFVLNVLGVCPQFHKPGNPCASGSASELFGHTPSGHASVSDALRQVLQEGRRDTQMRLVMVLTDGEAVDRDDFKSLLDEVDDGLHGSVQVCLVGLNFEPQGLEWFDDPECEAPSVRTIRPWEVEQQQMLWRKVIETPAQYNFPLHTFRALLTNLFPAEYDYKASLQCLRRRLYSTLHAFDRRITGTRDAAYMAFGSDACILPVVEGFRSLVGATPKAPKPPPPTPSLEAPTEAAMAEELDGKQFRLLFFALKPILAGDKPVEHLGRGMLSLLQQALAVLQPGEMSCRDLKFSDPWRNARALKRAVSYLKKAAESRRR